MRIDGLTATAAPVHGASSRVSGIFKNILLSGQNSYAGAETNTGALKLQSDFPDLSNTDSVDEKFSLSSISPMLSIAPNKSLNTFRAVASGQFSSDPAPIVNYASAAPEPSTWAMMLVGFGIIGIRMRKRSNVRTMPSCA
jgi:hypothetical protein